MKKGFGFILFGLLLAGCSRGPSAQTDRGVETQATDPESGVVLRTHIDRAEIGAADRLNVEVDVEWASPVQAALVEPDFAGSGWTLVEAHRDPVEQTGTGFLAASTYLLEPFLPGEYSVPQFTVSIVRDPGTAAYEFSSLATPIEVQSVLDGQDGGALDPAYGLMAPSAEPHGRSNLSRAIIGGILVLGVLAGFIIWRLTRRSSRRPIQPSAYAQLQEVANDTARSDSAAYELLYHAFNRLDPRLQSTSEIRVLIANCERARFSPDEQALLDPRVMARHTLELLGTADEEAA